MIKNKEVKQKEFLELTTPTGLKVSVQYDELYDGPRKKVFTPRDNKFLKK